MGIFDGILLISDIDGTFEISKTYPSPQKNVEAIKYFTKNGGSFCFASGRMADYLKLRGFDKLANAPCALCNGAVVYDPADDRIIHYNRLPHTTKDIAERILPYADGLIRFIAPTKITADAYTNIDILNIPDDVANVCPPKQVNVFKTKEQAIAFENSLKTDSYFDDCYICRSWDVGVEILNKLATKGDAIEFIKKHVGADISVAIGDYGNDLTMIQKADIGVAVGDATDELKAAADIVVCECTQNAVADLIYKLEEKLYKNK